MSDETPLSDVVNDVARMPAATEVDGVKVQHHSLADLNDTANRQAASAAVKNRHRGLFISKLVPPGTVGQ